MTLHALTPQQKQDYDTRGFIILPAVFTSAECEALIAHTMDLHSGKITHPSFAPRQPEDWNRTHNSHGWDPQHLRWLLDPRLRGPLHDCFGDQAHAVQTMYFFKGSQQRRHQDQYYLPGCMSAWIALRDVGPDNGTIWVQVGSHLGKLITQGQLKDAQGQPLSTFGSHYDDAVDALFAQNAQPEVPVEAKQGDVVLFHGVLIHRGGPIAKPGSFRHVLANHYIPAGYQHWPYPGWLRYDFDGKTHDIATPPPA